MTKAPTYPLRLPRSVKAEVERIARNEGISVNQFVVREEPRSVGFSDRSDRAERLIECGEEGPQEALQPA
jgi:hypothetical protein